MKKVLFTFFLLVGFPIYSINLGALLFSLKGSYVFLGSRSLCHKGLTLSERIRTCISEWREGSAEDRSKLEGFLPQAFDQFSQKELHAMHKCLLPLLENGDSEFVGFYAKLWQRHIEMDDEIVVSLMPEQLKESAENTCQMASDLLALVFSEE